MKLENNKQVFKPINIREVVYGKDPKLAGKIPEFIYNWLNKILHLKEINKIITENEGISSVEFISGVLKYSNTKFEFIGSNNIPKSGKFIFAGNHPLGGLDGLILLKYLNEKIGKTQTLTNDFLMHVTPLSELFIPINKVGKQARKSAPLVENLYKSENQVLIFPAGLCSRKINGEIIDLKWQKHFIQKSIEYKIDIIPFYFEGRNSNFFYNLAKIRMFLKIKFNIEMIFLADEMFKHKNKTFKVYFGKPIPYSNFDHSKNFSEWADEVKKITYMLKTNN